MCIVFSFDEQVNFLREKYNMVENIVTLKDAQGNTYKLKRTVYNGETFNVFGLFKTPDILLPALKEYQPRTDDIWLLTYQKAGNCKSVLCTYFFF